MMENRAGSGNLGDLLRIKQDDNNRSSRHHNNNGGHLVGLTLGAVLSGEVRSTPVPVSVPVQSNRTLLDIIRDEPFVKNGKDERKSWKLLKQKLKWRVGAAGATGAGAGSSWGSFVSNNHENQNNISRFIPRRNSAGSMSNPGGAELEAPTSLASLMMRSSSAVMLNGRQSQDEDRDRAADFGSGEADEGQGESGGVTGEGEEQPVRMSLMALLEETDRQIGADGSTYMANDEEDDAFVDAEEVDDQEEEEEGSGGERVGEYNNCCVCMVRLKGAAFIPCGHTFCRLCSRELWVQRGNCPLCNNLILEILDIF